MQDRVAMWQHRHYAGAIVLVGLALPFVVGFLHNGWKGGIGGFMLAGVGRNVCRPELQPFASIQSVICGRATLQHGQLSRKLMFVSILTSGKAIITITIPIRVTIAMDRTGTFDPSKWLIYSLSKLRLASSLRTASSGS